VGVVSLGAILLLVCSLGGKWAFGSHLSKAFVFFSAFLLIRHLPLKSTFRHPALCGAVCLCGWYLMSGVVSPSPVAAWSAVSGLWSMVLLAVLGWISWKKAHRTFLEGMLVLFSLSQVAVILYGKFFSASLLLFFPGNPQYVSFWLCAIFFLAWARLMEPSSIMKIKNRTTGLFRIGWGVVVFVSCAGIFFLPVRSSLVALFFGSLVFGWFRFGRKGLVSVGLFFVLVAVLLPQSVVERRFKFQDTKSYKRIDIWKTSVRAVIERPLLGWGPGQFENAYWRHEIPQKSDPVRYEMSTDRAHNELLQLFVEAGIPGGVFALFCLIGIWISIPKGYGAPGIKGAWAAVISFSLVNSPLVLPACGFLVGILGALGSPRWISLRCSSDRVVPMQWMKGIILSVVFIFSLGEVALAINETLGTHRFLVLDSMNTRRVEAQREKAYAALHGKDGEAQKNGGIQLRSFHRWRPDRAELWRDMAHLELDHRHPPRFEAAVAYYEKALSLRPHQATWWRELGDVMAMQGNRQGAPYALREAFRLEPHFFDAMVGYGRILLFSGSAEEALRWLNHTREISQSWPLSNPSDSGYRKTVLHRDYDLNTQLTVLSQMEMKKYSEALRTLRSMDSMDLERQMLEIRCLFLLGRPEEAEETIRSTRLHHSENPRLEEMLRHAREGLGSSR
jgi:O-antigen ligase/tetratricopeptide (TPR) repeat protein